MKPDKLKKMVQNRKKWGWSAVFLCLCFLTACQQEIGTDPDLSGGGMFLMYNSDVKPLAGTTDKVRVIVFSGTESSGVKTWWYNREFSGSANIKIPLHSGEYHDIYTIINEEEGINWAGINTLAALNAVQISKNLPQDVNAANKQRFHCFKNVFARDDGSGIILDEAGNDISKVGLKQSEYTMAKVDLTFDLNPTTAEGITLKFTGAQLTGLPKYGFLWPPKAYNSAEFNTKSISLKVTVPGQQYREQKELLVPEYLVSGDRKVMLVIQADRYRGSEKIGSSEYRFPVGNAVGGAIKTDYNINRNKVYKFKFTAITGMGVQVDDWKVSKRVTDWEQQTINTEIDGAYGFFLQTNVLNDFKAVRQPRYVSFYADGPGTVWIDDPRDAVTGAVVAPNDLYVKVLWNDDTHKSGRLELKLGNWRTGSGYSIKVKMRANNIERTLTVHCVGARYAVKELDGKNIPWYTAMGYTDAMQKFLGSDFNREVMIREYSKGTVYRGCAGYWEGSANDPLTGIGCWRVATMREGLQYMSDTKKPSGYQYWAYEMGDPWRSDVSYTSYFYQGRLPSDMHHPGNTWIPQENRKNMYGDNRIKVLCVQDDKLEKYYYAQASGADYPTQVTFEEAERICEALNEGGKTDWRLPTAAEMAYTVQHAGTQGIPNNFGTGLYWLWGKVAAGVENPGGTLNPPGGVAHVRCVRERWNPNNP